MASIVFGSGKLFLKHPSTAQVFQVGILNDVSLNFEGSSKSLYGNKQFPVATVMTSKKVTGKAAFAQIDGRLISSVISGTVALSRSVMGEFVGTGTPVTVSPTGSVAGITDYGVIGADGSPLALTGAAPAVGYYSATLGTGVYTFNAGEPNPKTISYVYTTGSGNTLTISNADMGTQTNFSCFLQERGADGELFGCELLSVIVPSLNFSFKNEDFAAEDLSFEAQANAAGTVGKIYTE